ncbi:MAG: ABC transporter ATP-binding protein [Puniceicoccaceae bacterium]|nr:MAG: ABC transporter ATP-binding protein [Puniceicoccaceae bacterium]
MATSPSSKPPAIRIEGLTKDFALTLRGLKLRAVDNLDLTVKENQVFGLLGPNGSGKSTTIKVILGLLEPTFGSCEIFGIPSNNVRSRMDVGYLPEAPYFYRYLNGEELVRFYGRICQVPKDRLEDRVAEVLEWVGLKDAARRRVGTYSKGMLQRVGLAQALVHDPRLILLDEPTAGVDPVGSAEISELILKLKDAGKTILLCSHLLAQVEGICDEIAILNRGRLVLEGDLKSLVSERHRNAVMVENLPAGLEKELGAWLEAKGARLVGIETPRTTLDRIFLEHIGYRKEQGSSRQVDENIARSDAGKPEAS